MREVLWKKDTNCATACTILLKCDDCGVKSVIENYLTTVNLYDEPSTGIGNPIWLEDNRLYIMPVEFEALRSVAEVFDIKFVEEVCQRKYFIKNTTYQMKTLHSGLGSYSLMRLEILAEIC